MYRNCKGEMSRLTKKSAGEEMKNPDFLTQYTEKKEPPGFIFRRCPQLKSSCFIRRESSGSAENSSSFLQ